MSPETLIRNIRLPDHVSASGLVQWRAFKPDRGDHGQGLSCACAGKTIQSESELQDYITWSSTPIAPDRVGCCFLRQPDVVDAGLTVEPDPIDDTRFGSIHHLIQDLDQEDRCPDRVKLKVLANLANAIGDIRGPSVGPA